MRLVTFRLLTLAAALLTAPACGSSTGGGSTGTVDAGPTGSTTGDKSTNSGAVTAKGSDGKSTSVNASAAASSGSTSGTQKLGAMATDKILTLYISDASSLITITIDTDKNPLPATGIKAGDASSGAFVTYVGTAGSFTSDGSAGTIDVSNCPSDANNTVTVGKLDGVVVSGVAATGQASLTLDGTFNLVYFGGYGNLKCTAPVVATADASSTDVGSTAGGTCGYQVCADNSKNCCPYLPCLTQCQLDCANTANNCTIACASNPADMNCPMKCATDASTCFDGCFGKCNVTDSCKTVGNAFFTCSNKADQASCAGKTDNDKLSCEVDACCAEAKAAF